MTLINTSILKHPMNWVVVTLMLVLAGIGGHLVLSHFGMAPASTEKDSSQ